MKPPDSIRWERVPGTGLRRTLCTRSQWRPAFQTAVIGAEYQPKFFAAYERAVRRKAARWVK